MVKLFHCYSSIFDCEHVNNMNEVEEVRRKSILKFWVGFWKALIKSLLIHKMPFIYR